MTDRPRDNLTEAGAKDLCAVIRAYWRDVAGIAPSMSVEPIALPRTSNQYPVSRFAIRSNMVNGMPPGVTRALIEKRERDRRRKVR